MSATEVYRNIASMEPMLPDLQSAELAELSQKATLAIGELNAHIVQQHIGVGIEEATAR